MRENNRIIYAVFCGKKIVRTQPAYQHDTGHLVQLEGFNLPESYDVHFCNRRDGIATITHDCSGDSFPVPDEFFETAQTVLCWICSRSETDFLTLLEIDIPVIARPALPV